MVELRADKVYKKDIEYTKDGQKKSFTKYSIKSNNVWYTLEGKGRENIKENDLVRGEHETKDWQKGDKSGTEHILRLVDPALANIYMRLDSIELKLKEMKLYNKTEDAPPEIDIEVEDNSNDLPF